MNEIELNRSSHLIDPELAVWAFEIPIYLFLGGMVAGMLILTPLIAHRIDESERSRWTRWAPFIALGLLSVGMLMLFLDLAYKVHVFRFYTAFRLTSPMSWGSWVLLAIYPATLLFGIQCLNEKEVDWIKGFGIAKSLKLDRLIEGLRSFTSKHRGVISATNIVLGIGLGIYTGFLLSTLGVRHIWSSSVLAPLFLVSGFSTGAAFLLALPISKKEHHLLGRLDIAAIAIELVLIGVLFLGLVNGGEGQRSAAEAFLGGPYTAIFWSLVVIAGLAVPLLLEVREIKKDLKPTLLAPVLLLIGGLSLRWILVVAGQAMG